MAGAPRSRRGSFLPIPQRASYCFGDERLFPRQSGHSSFMSASVSAHQPVWPSLWLSTIPTQPIPPTPCRMMSATTTTTSATSATSHRQQGPNSHARRHSGIPRPSSGSSRQATSFVPSTPNPGGTVESAAPPPRSSWHSSNSHTNRPFLPYSQSQQQFPRSSKQNHHHTSHRHSTQLSSPTSPQNDVRLARSTQTNSVPSSRKDSRPQQSLMKPLSPPVPKSHLASRAGCFGPSSIPQSPSETCLPWSGKAPARADRHINVVDALLESRMTEAEIKRLSLDSSHRQHKRMSSSTMAMAATSPSTRKSSSFSDNINTPRPEAVRKSRAFPHSASSHASAAPPSYTKHGLPTSKTTSCILSPDDDWEIDLRLVHFAEPGPYWAGRYMTITGRLRQEGMNDNADMPLRPSGSQERLSSRSDDQRMKRALSELRSCCRTSPALQSFELFEKSLKKSLSVPSGSQKAVKTPAVKTPAVKTPAVVDRQPALSSSAETVPSNPCSALTTPTRVEHSFPNILSRLGPLPKSKTTGNLAATQSVSTVSLASPMASLAGATGPASPQQGHRQSRPSMVADNKTALLRDVREFVKTPVKMIHQRFSAAPRTPSYCSDVSTKVEAKKLSNSMTMPQIAPVTAAGSTAKRVQCERAKTPPTVVRVLDDEALNKNRRRSARKSNGDLVKGVLDASLKQVRLMGKLVGDGVSWMGSQEDLDIKVFATHAK